jgi:hypothetical protein|uniref:HMG box domain-containing protein n=1 Tax=viral metagenome TaxID=1070528 RepID=A0A6C0I8L8_9ZZZZ
MTDIEDLNKRVKILEDSLKNQSIKEKPPRKETEYNKFMKTYIAEQKQKGTKKSHRDLFTEAAKAWKEKK